MGVQQRPEDFERSIGPHFDTIKKAPVDYESLSWYIVGSLRRPTRLG